jgi:hypothetical protein
MMLTPLPGQAQSAQAESPKSAENAQAAASMEERMRRAIEQQKRSVRRQVGEGEDATDSWFTVPWPRRGTPTDAPGPLTPAERAKPAAVRSSLRPDCNPYAPSDLEELIQSAAEREGYESKVLHAVIRHESAYYPCAVSPKGAMGLMQLMPETARTFGVVNPLDPVENVNAGSRFLGQLLERYSGDLVLALGAYNAGPGSVDRHRGLPPYEETRDYVTRILRDLKGDRLRSELARAEQ